MNAGLKSWEMFNYIHSIKTKDCYVKKEDIKVDLNKGILTISGERKTKEEVKQEDYYKIETYFGKFSRSFTLPDNVDIENIEAKSDNGVLEIVIPKLKDDVSKKSIEIK